LMHPDLWRKTVAAAATRRERGTSAATRRGERASEDPKSDQDMQLVEACRMKRLFEASAIVSER